MSNNAKNEGQYNPFEKMTFTYDKCFLCGEILTDENSTEEHIYPKWLQNKFDLWDKQLILLNGTGINYRNLKIPCCKRCNNKMSEAIEKPIQIAVTGGYDSFKNIDKNIVFLWLNKLSYGMLFKELSLDVNRRDITKGKIYSQEWLEEHKMQYMFLQSIISESEYNGQPFSLLLFKIKVLEDENYWAFDDPFNKTFFIRMNDIGIIAHLMDNKYNEDFFLQFDHLKHLLHKELHPIQFAELCAKFYYKSSLFYRNPSYIMVMNEEGRPENIFSQGMSGYGYDDWSQKEYAKVLTYFLQPYGIEFDKIYSEDEKVMSWLYNEDGDFIEL